MLYCDNTSVIHLSNNHVYSRTKHTHVQYHFRRSMLEDDILALNKIEKSCNSVDVLMKTVISEKKKLYTTSVGILHRGVVAA